MNQQEKTLNIEKVNAVTYCRIKLTPMFGFQWENHVIQSWKWVICLMLKGRKLLDNQPVKWKLFDAFTRPQWSLLNMTLPLVSTTNNFSASSRPLIKLMINLYPPITHVHASRFVFSNFEAWTNMKITFHRPLCCLQEQTRTFSIVYDSDQENDFHALTQHINFNDK